MSIKVVARVRPLLNTEIDRDIIVQTQTTEEHPVVRIPNPKNSAESFSFKFNSVYDQEATQQNIFENEVSPTVKSLFRGIDVHIFAYGVTGSGKTHTVRGGKTLAERGIIPRLLSAIYRRGRKIEKDSNGEKSVEVTLSYYEIYNDKVFDLFEPVEKRPLAGLPIRDCGGKTVVAGLTDRPCGSLKEFEELYDGANVRRSTSATKLNANSSRSHAILCVKLSQTSEDQTITSTVSAIDLAGSEDNRRTANDKERLVESSSINKSLFVLAQCVEAIGKKQARIPYRESKMTRILSLGQNNGLTIMILNLAPVRSFHLDTLSTLQVANRTKKIEVREVENEPVFRNAAKTFAPPVSGPSIPRQPLRTIPNAGGTGLSNAAINKTKTVKAFSVYAEQSNRSCNSNGRQQIASRRPSENQLPTARHLKATSSPSASLSRATIEQIVNRMVDEKLATKALQHSPTARPPPALDPEIQRRLEALEHRVETKEDSRAEGLQFLLMAKQHQVRGEDASALRMYRLALPHFPENEKLGARMVALQEKLKSTSHGQEIGSKNVYSPAAGARAESRGKQQRKRKGDGDEDEVSEYHDELAPADHASGDEPSTRPRARPKQKRLKVDVFRDCNALADGELTPRTAHLLRVINTRDVAQIRGLKGVGAKKAESIVNSLCDEDDEEREFGLNDLEKLRGVGVRGLEAMRRGVVL